MTRLRAVSLLFAAFAALSAGPLRAEPAAPREPSHSAGDGAPHAASSFALRRISAGRPVTGRLGGSSQLLPDGTRYDLYLYQGRPGEEIVVTLRSREFVPLLAGGAVSGGSVHAEEQVGAADGSGSVQLRALAGPDGTYGIWVNALQPGSGGEYELTVQLPPGGRRPGMPTQTLEAVAGGEALTRVLSGADPTLADGSFYHLFVYAGDPGDELVVTLRSEDFGTFLSTGTLRGGAFHADTSDREGAGGPVSRLRVVVDGDGRFTIRVNAFRPETEGAYTLTVERASAADPQAGSGTEDIPEGPVGEGTEVWVRGLAGSPLSPPALTDAAAQGDPTKQFDAILLSDPAAKPER